MALLETLLAAGGGSITGAVAGVGTAYIQAELAKARLPLELKMLDVDVELAKQERRSLNEAQMEETRRAEVKAAAETFIAAHESDKATYGMWIVDAARGLVRPLITGWLVYLLTDMTLVMWELQGDHLDAEFWRELFKHLVVSWTYLTTTAVMYWFGSRGGRAPVLR